MPTDVPIPQRMQHLALDARGYPITYVTYVNSEGKPDFRITDNQRREYCIKNTLCGICGTEIVDEIVFIGGPISCETTHAFFDPPMHSECAWYAAKVCPFLTKQGFKYAEVIPQKDDAVIVQSPNVVLDPKRPDRMGLYSTDGYQIVTHNNEMIVVANFPTKIEWF